VTNLLEASLIYLWNGAPKSRKIPIAAIRSTYEPRSPPIWLVFRMPVSVTYFFVKPATEVTHSTYYSHAGRMRVGLLSGVAGKTLMERCRGVGVMIKSARCLPAGQCKSA